MTEEDKRKYITYLSLRGELDSVECRGTSLYMDGKRTDADHIASVCVFNDRGDYMRDYVTDKKGQLDRLYFDKVRNR